MMKPWTWLRSLSVILALFATGHTLGTAVPRVKRGPQEAAVFQAMQNFHFPIMGFERTYWEFYRGFALVISVQLLIMTLIAWQLAALSKRNPQQALPFAVALQLGCVGLFVVSWMFFFGAPIFMAAIATLCSTAIVVMLSKQTRMEMSL